MTTGDLLARLQGVKQSGAGWEARCPAHDDHKASLSITEGKDGRILLKCFAGCSVESIVGALDYKLADLFPQRANDKRNCKTRIIGTYDYTDENGNLLFQCVRKEPKDFCQRRPDPARPGEWIWNLKGVRRVLYRLPEVKAAIAAEQTVYIAEGEKDVDALVKHGFTATCNPLGAKVNGSTWLPEHTETLRGAASVVVIADKDETGRAHARVVATVLLRGGVKSVKLIELPDRDNKAIKDAADFFSIGGTVDEFKTTVGSASEFVPTAKSPASKLPDAEGQDRDDNDNASNGEDSQKPARESAATRLVNFADEFVFFHDAQSRAYARLDVSGHVEIWPVNSAQFRNLLAQTFYKRTRTAINRNALADGIATLVGRACFDSPEEPVHLRVAAHGEHILIDLCDPQWRVVTVTANGWKVDTSPVAFVRTGAMRSLPSPAPASQGSLTALWDLLNVTPAQRPLLAGALLNYFHPHGPYFVTNLVGEQGTAKSCAAKILRMLIDPNEIPLRSPPRTEQDLLVQAASNWCVALDNLSVLPPWLSDTLCRLSTGGGHSARSLYTDAEEFTLAVKRPVILNGIEDVAARPDLAERALQIELETIPDNRRMSEKELWRKFEPLQRVIFSGILNALVCALRELPNIKPNSLPRMADAALWATAGETAFGWQHGTFFSTYTENLNTGAIASVEAHPVGVALRQLIDGKPEWNGEPTQLLKALNEAASEALRQSRNWPQNPRSLSSCLRRLAQALRRSGIELDFSRGKRRGIRLCKAGNFASPASPEVPNADVGGANDAKIQPLQDTPCELFEEIV